MIMTIIEINKQGMKHKTKRMKRKLFIKRLTKTESKSKVIKQKKKQQREKVNESKRK